MLVIAPRFYYTTSTKEQKTATLVYSAASSGFVAFRPGKRACKSSATTFMPGTPALAAAFTEL